MSIGGHLAGCVWHQESLRYECADGCEIKRINDSVRDRSMTYAVAEKFKSIQGEGLYAGTPMAFIRFVGCSVGKKICNACDTDFEKTLGWRGGGHFEASELAEWSLPYKHICLTGGEPLDQDLEELLDALRHRVVDPKTTYEDFQVHIETSGTVSIEPLMNKLPTVFLAPNDVLWICVSPKPGYREDMIDMADEIKVIVPGLGSGEGWPTIEDAKRWAGLGKIVYLQPRNAKFDVDAQNLRYVQDLIAENPQFRLSVQMHKILKVQ